MATPGPAEVRAVGELLAWVTEVWVGMFASVSVPESSGCLRVCAPHQAQL